MKKICAFLALGLLLAGVAVASPRMVTKDLMFTDGATTSLRFNLAAKESSGTADTDTSISYDLSAYTLNPDTVLELSGVVQIIWPYTASVSNDGDSLYFKWIGSFEDTVWQASAWTALVSANAVDSTAVAPLYKFKNIVFRVGSGAGYIPYGYRYYKFLLQNGSSGATALGPGPDTNANLYSIRVRVRLRIED